MRLPLILTLTNICLAFYNPESGEDWTLLKPLCLALEGSYDSVPFRFGFVVNPYVVNDEGEYEEPEHVPAPKSHTIALTTTFTTSYLTSMPKPTKAIDVHQIGDGQIQRFPNESTDDADCTEEEEVEEVDDCNDDESGEFYAKRGFHDIPRHKDEIADDDCDGQDEASPVNAVACSTESALLISLEDGILRDSNNRIGSIVMSHQFQFDGPVPQHGTIYAAGWSITSEGRLALGDSTKFYQCASGEFFNLYDEPIGYQCNPVVLEVVELIEC